MKLPTVICIRCNHKWIPRVEKPVLCPQCGSAYWNITRTYNTKFNTPGLNANELDNKSKETNDNNQPPTKND